jgi:LmbE family N-acetylglucosaminyl deacetylase
MIYILSPHIDDAIFSLGGMLADLKEPFCIIDIFTITGYSLSVSGDVAEITEKRETEERAVCEKLGCTYIFLGFRDRPIRENAIDVELFERLSAIIEEGSIVYAPLCFSCFHEDHKITKSVAIDLARYDSFELRFYEDLPYVAYNGKAKESTDEAFTGLTPELIEIDIKKKMELVRMYDSQVNNKVIRPIELYAYDKASNRYTERIWHTK